MQINRTTLSQIAPGNRAFCVLDCEDCTGMCLSLFMMLTREEQDAVCQQYKSGTDPVTRH